MKISALAVATFGLLTSSPGLSTTDAFVPRLYRNGGGSVFVKGQLQSSITATVQEVVTKPIAGMKPGTSGLRKKVEVWQAVDPANKYYLENFIQSLLDTAVDKNAGAMPKT
jgi:phosphoglucomutase